MHYKVSPFTKLIDRPEPITKTDTDAQVSVYRQTTPVEQFYRQITEHANGEQSTRIVTDIYMLLNQKRLDRMTLQAFSEHMMQSAQHNDKLATLRANCTDAQLMQFCKSRYIQSPSELLTWSKYLESEYPQAPAPQKPAAPEPPANPAATSTGD